eukprot:12057015-Alexandrium_andersonii.AAC.1
MLRKEDSAAHLSWGRGRLPEMAPRRPFSAAVFPRFGFARPRRSDCVGSFSSQAALWGARRTGPRLPPGGETPLGP